MNLPSNISIEPIQFHGNPNVLAYPIQEHIDPWYAFRERGLGSSDIAPIVAPRFRYKMKNRTAADVWLEKVGINDPRHFINEAMLDGIESEPKIAALWRYYDGKKDSYGVQSWVGRRFAHRVEVAKGNATMEDEKFFLRNWDDKPGYLVNKKYPWLFVSPDRIIRPGQRTLADQDVIISKHSPLECKAIGGFQAAEWEDEVPPYNKVQVSTQMIVMEVDYAEIAYLKDGRWLKIVQIELEQDVADAIIEDTYNFWHNLILPARLVQAEINKAEQARDMNKVADLSAKLYQYEPPPDDSPAYQDYRSKRFLTKREQMMGSPEMYDVALYDKCLQQLSLAVDDERQLRKNILIHHMQQHEAEQMSFDEEGAVSYAIPANKKKPEYRNKLKAVFDSMKLRSVIQELPVEAMVKKIGQEMF